MTFVHDLEALLASLDNPLLARHSSWERVPLGLVARVQNGAAFESSRFGTARGVPLIRIRDLGKTSTVCLYDGPYDPAFVVQPGDLLVGMDGDFKTARWTGPPGLLNQRVCRILVRPEYYDGRLLELVLQGYLDAIHTNTSSQTVTHLSSKTIAAIPIPLPPLGEQRRIVAKVESLLAEVYSTRDRLRGSSVILKQFRQSVLAAACSGRLTKPRHGEWQERRFGDVILGDPQNGIYKPQSLYGSGVPIVRIDDYHDGIVPRWESLKRVRLERVEIDKYGLRCGDILVNRVNSVKFLGKAVAIPRLDQAVVFESNMMRCTLDIDRVVPEFALLYLLSPQGMGELRKNAKHAVNQSSINQQDVMNVSFPLPPLAEQQEIVKRTNELFAIAEVVGRGVMTAAARAARLANAILARAFRGELVPTEADLARQQDRDYESASALLERIRGVTPGETKSVDSRPRARRDRAER